jgi:hypothetical protein
VTRGIYPSYWTNRAGDGARYNGTFGGIMARAHGIHVVSGRAEIAGGGVQAEPPDVTALPATNGTGNDIHGRGLNLGNRRQLVSFALIHRIDCNNNVSKISVDRQITGC